MQIQPLIKSHPGIVEKVKQLMEDGMTKSAIARHLNVSRDQLRTLMRSQGLDDIYSPPKGMSQEEVNTAVEMFVSGRLWSEVEKITGFNSHLIRRMAKSFGYDLKQLSATHRLHRWDGRVFGSWTVMPGTTGITGHGTVMTECVCGKQVVNLKSNLLSTASRSCGCVGFKKDTVGHDSAHFQWTCLETGEVVETTLALARKLEVRNPTLYRLANKSQDFEDSLGYNWRPSVYKRENESRRDLIPHIDFIKAQLDDGKSFVAIAEDLQVELTHMYKFASKHNLHSQFKASIHLNEDQVRRIRQLNLNGVSAKTISLQFNVTTTIIYNIIKGKTYSQV